MSRPNRTYVFKLRFLVDVRTTIHAIVWCCFSCFLLDENVVFLECNFLVNVRKMMVLGWGLEGMIMFVVDCYER